MRVISKSRLREFWENPKTPKDAQRYLMAWYKLAITETWRNFAELRGTFGSADQVGNCVVFDVGNNRYRLIGRVLYATEVLPGVIYVLKVMTHAEYDEDKWPDECGCHKPKPKPKTKPVSRPTKTSRKRRK